MGGYERRPNRRADFRCVEDAQQLAARCTASGHHRLHLPKTDDLAALQTWYIGRARGWRVGRAPDDIDILEFALKWRINPQELREQWSLRDIRWLEIVDE